MRCQAFGSPKGSNRAYTLRATAGTGTRLPTLELARAAFTPPRRLSAWVSTTGYRIDALAIVRPRSGPQSWEVTQLFSGADGRADDLVGGLLENVADSTAARGAERVFLRVRSDDPLIAEAQHGGFFPCVSEVLYERGPVPWRWQRRPNPALREMEPSDEYNAFRLYNAATPAEVRHSSAMTFDQWRACREQSRGRWRQFVMSSESGLKGWVATRRGPINAWIGTLAGPEDEGELVSMVDFALGRLNGARNVYCLVPEYQVAVQTALLGRGFKLGPEYTILVKSNARVEREIARGEVGVGTT